MFEMPHVHKLASIFYPLKKLSGLQLLVAKRPKRSLETALKGKIRWKMLKRNRPTKENCPTKVLGRPLPVGGMGNASEKKLHLTRNFRRLRFEWSNCRRPLFRDPFNVKMTLRITQCVMQSYKFITAEATKIHWHMIAHTHPLLRQCRLKACLGPDYFLLSSNAGDLWHIL